MSKKEAYKQKVEAQVELAEAKLIELKAKAKNSAADVRIKYDQQINKIEQAARLKELGEARKDAWEHLKEGVEHTWKKLSDAVRTAIPPIL